MTSALIGMMVAWLFLLIPAILVSMIPNKKMKYEKKVGVEAVIWIVCSIVVLFLHTGYGLVTI
ncbi:hypothetical protein, partial [Rossellomorea vietnamensis]|uniref:hypothetical protein n=1 Tax=Rossellomorea vietnamensis TaxID=218284 RepID=UPI003089AA4B